MRLSIFRCGAPAAVSALAAALLAAGWHARSTRACPFCTAASQTLSQELSAADAAVIAELVTPLAPADEADGQEDGDLSGLVDPLPGEGPEGASLGAAGAAPAAPAAAARFRIVEALRGGDRLAGVEELEVVYFGNDPGKQFLITAIADQGLEWTTPLPLSARGVTYVKQLGGLPEAGVERLKFFQQHLEDAEPLLAQDAYDEFARTPYADVVALGPEMPRDKLLAWIESPEVGPSSRRLYLTMLGVCGRPADVELLEKMLLFDYRAVQPGLAAAVGVSAVVGVPCYGSGLIDEVWHGEERRMKESLDALLACYLILKGPAGLELVNQNYLGNPQIEYKYLHSAIMALRFHGEETNVLPRDQLLASMRLALDHREFADQVIPDLTRWEDWSVLPRLVGMFKNSPEDDWIRQPVASYLLVAADQDGEVGTTAAAALAELEQQDPETIKRARSLAAFSFLPRASLGASKPAGGEAAGSAASAPGADAGVATAEVAPPPQATEGPPGGAAEALAGAETPAPAAAAASSPAASSPAPSSPAPATDPLAAAPVANATAAEGPSAASTPASAVVAASEAAAGAAASPTALRPPSVVTLVGVPLLAGLILVVVFAVLLRGIDPRPADRS